MQCMSWKWSDLEMNNQLPSITAEEAARLLNFKRKMLKKYTNALPSSIGDVHNSIVEINHAIERLKKPVDSNNPNDLLNSSVAYLAEFEELWNRFNVLQEICKEMHLLLYDEENEKT